jgi:transposase
MGNGRIGIAITTQWSKRPIEIDMREAVNAMFCVLRTGCQWEKSTPWFSKLSERVLPL